MHQEKAVRRLWRKSRCAGGGTVKNRIWGLSKSISETWGVTRPSSETRNATTLWLLIPFHLKTMRPSRARPRHRVRIVCGSLHRKAQHDDAHFQLDEASISGALESRKTVGDKLFQYSTTLCIIPRSLPYFPLAWKTIWSSIMLLLYGCLHH